MSKFVIYNIQLLPINNNEKEVGINGYRKLFSKLRDLNQKHRTQKTQPLFHHALGGESYIGPEFFAFKSGYIYGHFIRYTKTDTLKDLGTGQTVFRAGKKTTVSKLQEIPFIFDTNRHLLAIDKQNIPKNNGFQTALEKFLQPISNEEFPHHELTINLISTKKTLEEIFDKAIAYRTVDVTISPPNGGETEGLLRDLREKHTRIKVHASGAGNGEKGRMSGVPEILKTMLRAAVLYGAAKMSYLATQEGEKAKWQNYDSADSPASFTVRKSSSDQSDADYFSRVHEKLKNLELDQLSSEE
ncbi:uncharacterized protein DUF4747 [Comamonas sp. BIGb0124]|uniref:DUF4747 family protein n=1 Tax=Comamonas sp. BIGb0124 TaxID=2485130 RepID=UPI000F46C5AB|nr:DUF4747 family protein [Comamonas sp. BIGb0124]ROR22453.1 uncharacterized protein DUF4747 [Comamonas sp. BIGb0124]